ncbi:MAG: glycoside hydrolase family 13 protein [Pseudomonadota bacterium]
MTCNLRLAACVGLLATMTTAGYADGVERVDPPHWYTGFEHREVQLMFYGDGVGALTVSVAYPGVTLARSVRVASPNYLFVYLELSPEAKPGSVDLVLTDGERRIVQPYELRARRPAAARPPGFSARDAIYLITPDRFANGDPTNDTVAALGDALDRRNPGGRHGGDLDGIAAHLDYIEGLGFTQLWLNPVLENRAPQYSYHGYATTDFYRVDPRYGDNARYRTLVAAARERGIGVIMDVIVNHIGSNHPWLADTPTADWLNFPDVYVQTTHERTTVQDPNAAEVDRRAFADGWFVPTMPDLNQRNPLLGDYLVQNALWWVEYAGLSGIRVDTYSYPDKHYMTEWTRRLTTEYPELNIVGEEWSLNPAVIAYWQAGKVNHDGYVSHLPSVMDFPLQDALVAALLGDDREHGEGLAKLYRAVANDFAYPEPQRLVTFPDNHDMTRIYTQLGEDYALFEMALLAVATMRGIPQVYYGTELLKTSPLQRDDGRVRSDFPGGWSGDTVDAFTGKGLSAEQAKAQRFVAALFNWRKRTPVLHSGKLTHYVPLDGLYTYFRYDAANTAMVMINKSEDRAVVDTARFRERIGSARSARDAFSGDAVDLTDSVAVPARGWRVLEFATAP